MSAILFAIDRHHHQLRKGEQERPYVIHPLEAAELLVTFGKVTDEDIIIGAILHDILEDTETTLEEFRARFGETVLNYVQEVSDDKKLQKQERKDLQIEMAPSLSMGASLIRLADKICNVREMRTNPPVGWDVERKLEYIDWAASVVNAMELVNQPLNDLFEQEYEKSRNDLLK